MSHFDSDELEANVRYGDEATAHRGMNRASRAMAKESAIPPHHPRAEQIAREFHEAYEDLAPEFGYRTRKESAVPWDEVPSGNKKLMKATVTRLLRRGIIR